jgi:hypothetical protein
VAYRYRSSQVITFSGLGTTVENNGGGALSEKYYQGLLLSLIFLETNSKF